MEKLTFELQTIEDIKRELRISLELDVRFLKIKLKNLERKGKIISIEILNEKYWKLLILKTFKVNDYISLKLENDIINVYVNNEKFDQCKYLLLNIPSSKIEDFDDIQSIDAKNVLQQLFQKKYRSLDILPDYDDFDKKGPDIEATFTVRLKESISINKKAYGLKVEGVASKLKHAKIKVAEKACDILYLPYNKI